MKPDSYTNQSWIKGSCFSGDLFDLLFLPTVTTDVTTRFFEISECVPRVLLVFYDQCGLYIISNIL
jgi:hypothetical protein